MSFYDAFRGFFGFPGRGSPRDPLFGSTTWDEEDEEGEESPGLAQPPPDFGFGFPPGGSRGAFEELFRDMSELLGVFGGAWAGSPQPFAPALPGPGGSSSGRSLRDSMLKPSDSSVPDTSPGGSAGTGEPARPWSPFLGLEGPRPASPGPKEDRDLDSQVSSAGLGTLLRPEQPKCHSYFQSISVTKVTLPDGVVEERRTVQDSSGHQETTVRRHSGHQAPGSTREQVANVDDRELAQFVGTWAWQEELQAPNLSHPSSALGTFFRRWFSSW